MPEYQLAVGGWQLTEELRVDGMIYHRVPPTTPTFGHPSSGRRGVTRPPRLIKAGSFKNSPVLCVVVCI